MMADEAAAVVEEGVSPAQSPLVTITFQRNTHRREKYLEAEPKALGITQMGLSVYMIVSLSVFLNNSLSDVGTDVTFLVSSVLVIIAGSTAVAAQSLHLATLRACLGTQIVASVASITNIVCALEEIGNAFYFCWREFDASQREEFAEVCHRAVKTKSDFFTGAVLIHATLLAISVALAAYCCKVANCCGPPPKMPVITVQAPPAQP